MPPTLRLPETVPPRPSRRGHLLQRPQPQAVLRELRGDLVQARGAEVLDAHELRLGADDLEAFSAQLNRRSSWRGPGISALALRRSSCRASATVVAAAAAGHGPDRARRRRNLICV